LYSKFQTTRSLSHVLQQDLIFLRPFLLNLFQNYLRQVFWFLLDLLAGLLKFFKTVILSWIVIVESAALVNSPRILLRLVSY
jgi:hypothetical protein